MKIKIRLALCAALQIFVASCASRNSKHAPLPLAVVQTIQDRKKYETTASKFVIATQGIAETEAAKEIFNKGGNIIDAAVAASFAMGVERPQSTGIGGGGFLLFHQASTGKTYAIDFRDRTPLDAKKSMYVGEPDTGSKNAGGFWVGVPGVVAGLTEIHRKFGVLPLKVVMEPAIDLAEKGFQVYPHLAKSISSNKEVLAKYPASRNIYLKESGEPFQLGDRLVQKDLAKTLKLIAEKGSSVFYKGSIAEAIVKESRARDGLLTREDFANFKPRWSEPVRSNYKGYEIESFPYPSLGGMHIEEILNILENDSLKAYGLLSAKAIHLEASAMQQVFADRMLFIDDPDVYNKFPSNGVLSKAYAQQMREKINLQKARSADEVRAGDFKSHESSDTSTFSIMDSEGNAVVSTQSINGYMGSKVVVPGTGILLNNDMDGFITRSPLPKESKSKKKIQKAILSSMAPTIILKDGKPVLALGAPGGTRIISCIAQTILNFIDFKLPLYDSINVIRIHHEWKPDELVVEPPGLPEATIKTLRNMGYKVKIAPILCKVNGVSREGTALRGAADSRDLGSVGGE